LPLSHEQQEVSSNYHKIQNELPLSQAGCTDSLIVLYVGHSTELRLSRSNAGSVLSYFTGLDKLASFVPLVPYL
jgi:hypothetical protein